MRISRSDASPSTRGLTLVEMLVVLAILLMILAIVVPSFLKPVAHQELVAAADQVRDVIANARLEAIESGHACTFCCEPGGHRFSVEDDENEVIEEFETPPEVAFAEDCCDKVKFDSTGRTVNTIIKLICEQQSIDVAVRGFCGDSQIRE